MLISSFPRRFNIYLTLCVFNVVMSGVIVESDLLNKECILENNSTGVCVQLKYCATAIELIQNHGRPKNCSLDGLESIVCCDRKRNVGGAKRRPGFIAEQYCNDTYANDFKNLRLYNESTIVTLQGEPFIGGFGGYGGAYSAARDYKHMAALGFGIFPDISWLCGGSLITTSFVLTAAHCITAGGLGRLKVVRLGDLNLKRTDDDASPQDFNIKRIILHPEYTPPSIYHDIALIELDGNAQITNWVRPGCLHTDVNVIYSSWSATGWGVTTYNGEQADHLQVMKLNATEFEICKSAYDATTKKRLPYGIDNKTQICASHPEADTCQGDSGGPLQTTNRYFLRGYTIIGVTSFGKACGLTKSPGLYTRIAYYLDWIESVIWPRGYY